MVRIDVETVCVDIPVLSHRARSLRTIAMAKARSVGGRVDSSAKISIVRALDNVSFSLKQGDRLGLVGLNGAGKTTLIRVLADIYAPTSGRMTREGVLVPMFDINIGFEDESTGIENIFTRGLMTGKTRREIEREVDGIIEFSGLGEYIDMPIRTYSSGMLLRLMFSIATSVRGDIILMDEWLAVGDSEFRTKANDRLLKLTREAGILVMASHDPALIKATCNVGLRLESGKVVAYGPIQEVLAA